jgi:hypothetical protein
MRGGARAQINPCRAAGLLSVGFRHHASISVKHDGIRPKILCRWSARLNPASESPNPGDTPALSIGGFAYWKGKIRGIMTAGGDYDKGVIIE